MGNGGVERGDVYGGHNNIVMIGKWSGIEAVEEVVGVFDVGGEAMD